jgi:predicted MPP superfamily phosphohydrolase
MLLLLFLVLLLPLALHLVAADGMADLFFWLFPAAADWFTPIFWAFHLLLWGLIVYGIAQARKGVEPPRWWVAAAHLLLLLVVSELVFDLALLTGDAWRWIRGDKLRGQGQLLTAGLLAFVPVTALLYGIWRGKYRYTVKKIDLYFTDLPDAFSGFTITQISDVHAGSFGDPLAVQKGIDKLLELQSDLFVFTGDLVNNRAEEFVPWLPYFSRIKAAYGQFSVLGNHDYGDYVRWSSAGEKAANLQQLQQLHAQTGFTLLNDQSVVLEKAGQKIYLLGVQNWGAGFSQYGNYDRALQGVPENAFKILLSHDPTHFNEIISNHPAGAQLTLSGHTHGMQFGWEWGRWRWSPVQYRYRRWAGLYSENNRYLYINRGFGFLGFSGRVGIWPEITQIRLLKV